MMQPQLQPPQQDVSHHDWQLARKMEALLGSGPARFGPVKTEMCLDTMEGIRVYEAVKCECETIFPHGTMYADTQILRAVQYTGYNLERSVRLLKRMDPFCTNITALDLEKQLMTKTIFPLPGLEAYDAQDLFYMRPSRFFPACTPSSLILANLVYVMDSIYEKYRDSSRTIGFIANMKDWTMDNFSVDCCYQFLEILQGHKGPQKVDLVLIVNPPVWFNKVWRMVKPMLSPCFQRKVHIVQESQLNVFLCPGFEDFLPASEFQKGRVSVDDLVMDFIAFRVFLEAETRERISPWECRHHLNRQDSPKQKWKAERQRSWNRRLFSRRLSAH